jgi:MtrB/PioB family decaheme-associated outer membrane protein
MKMRTRTMILIGALLLVFAGGARAQQQPSADAASQTPIATAPASTTPFTPKLGQIDFGFRGDSLSGDAARYQRFRDLRQGGYVDRFRLAKETDQWAFRATANNVGYRDQRFTVAYQDIGKLKLNAEWNQIPLFISDSTRTLYKDNGNGVLTIADPVQLTLQNAGTAASPATYTALRSALAGAQRYDLRSRRDIGTLNLVYSLNQDVDVKFDVRNTNRNGANLMSFGFGTSPGLNPVVEFGVPMDDRTTDIKGSIEFANQRGLFNVGYNASWFSNHIPTVQFDNPLRAVDISGGPASGLAVMWPTNHSFSVNVNGSYKLPARSRASAFISVGQWDQNQSLVSPTVNSALTLVAPPLERPTADAKADIVSMVYNFNSRPNDFIWLNAKYRYYDYANKTPLYETLALVGDWALGTATWENEPASLKRNTIDLDASISAHKYLGIGMGFTREASDRTHRIFEKTAEDTYRVSIDSTGNQFVTLRTKFEHSNREGSGFESALLDEVGEQPDTRHFDIANRTRDRLTTTLSITPTAYLDFNGSVGTGKDKYGQTGFGLRNNDNRTWNVGVDVLPTERVNLGVNYGEEKYTALQYSRTANPITATDVTFNDPTRDWWMDQADKVKTFSASADFLKCLPKTDIRFGYDISDGNATYVYNLKPEQKVFTAAVPLTQLAPLKNRLTDGRMDVQYFIRPNLAVGGSYWYEEYKVEDFALGDTTLNSLAPANGSSGVFASAIYSGYLYRNYRAHTGWLRMTFLW